MIRFLNDETVAGHRYGKGALARFDDATEAALIAQLDAENYPLVLQPVEMLFSTAVAESCESTGVDEILGSFTIPVGIIGVNSILQIEPLWNFDSSANDKILKVNIGGVTVYNTTRTTAASEGPLITIANRNSLTSQIKPQGSLYYTNGGSASDTYTIDFSVSVDVDIIGQRENAGDDLTLEYYRLLHFVGA